MALLRSIMSKLAAATGVAEKRQLYHQVFTHVALSAEDRVRMAQELREWSQSLHVNDRVALEAWALYELVVGYCTSGNVDDAVEELNRNEHLWRTPDVLDNQVARYVGAARVVVGVALYRRGDHSEGLPHVRSGADAILLAEHWQLRLDALQVLGEAAMYDGDFTAAEAIARSLQSESMERGDNVGQSIALRLMGNLRVHDGQLRDAEELYTQALSMYEGDVLQEQYIRTELSYGIALAYQSKTQEALRVLRSALNKAEKAELWAVAAHALNSIADIHFVQGEFSDSQLIHESALRFAERSNNVVRLVLAHGHLAEVLERVGESERSVQHLEQSLAFAQRSGHAALVADQEVNAAEIFARQGDTHRADALFRSAISRIADSGAHATLATYHSFYARFLLHQERFHESIVQYEMALPLLREANLNPTLFRTLYFTGKSYQAIGEYSQAAQFAFESYDVLERFSLDIIHETKERLLRELQADQMKRELEFHVQAKQQMETLLDSRTRELCAMATSLSQRNEMIESVLQVLDSHRGRNGNIADSVRQALLAYEPSNEERAVFEHQLFSGKLQFMSALSRMNPSLTRRELHIASLLLLDLPSKEIAYLIHSSVAEIDAYRTRLRKKLGLPLRADLCQALQRIEREAHASSLSEASLPNKLREAFPLLTKKEEEIVLMILQGQSTKTIARLLRSSERTVENHRYRLRKKLFPESSESLASLLLARLGATGAPPPPVPPDDDTED